MRTSGDDMKKTSILVVDDDKNEMNSLAIGLRLEGFEADGVDNGAEALSMLKSSSYEVVLIDLMMPEMNGLQLARQIRANCPGTVTIMMSAYHLSPVQLAKADTGVVGFVPKPFCFEDLVGFIRQKTNTSPISQFSQNKEFSKPFDIPAVLSEIESQRTGSL